MTSRSVQLFLKFQVFFTLQSSTVHTTEISPTVSSLPFPSITTSTRSHISCSQSLIPHYYTFHLSSPFPPSLLPPDSSILLPAKRTMVRALDIAFAAMCLAITAVVLVEFPQQLPDSGTCTAATAAAATTTTTTTTTTQVPRTSSDEVVLPLAVAATVALLAAVALVFRHLHLAGGDRRLSELVSFMLCASAAILQHVFSVQPAGAGFVIDVGARARALSLAAARMLPAAAAVTFFLSVALVLVHVRSGGGEDRGDTVAGDGPVLRVLSKTALEAAAVLFGLMMVMALYTT